MILEHAPFGRRGYYASFTLQGVQAGRSWPRRVFLPLAHYMKPDDFASWGWRIPFLLSVVVIIAGYIIRRNVDETPAFAEESEHHEVPASPIVTAIKNSWRDMIRVICMALMNVIPVVTSIFGAAYAVQPGYGIGFEKDVYLWIPVLGNIVAVIVIPFVGNLSDKVGRRPPIIVGAIVSGLLSFGYLYAISIHNVPMAIVMSLVMWGVVYQGYNAVFPSFYPELFPTKTRVSGMAISQNIGTGRHRDAAGDFRRRGAARSDEHPDEDRRAHARHMRDRGHCGMERTGNLPDAPERSRPGRRRASAEAGIRSPARAGGRLRRKRSSFRFVDSHRARKGPGLFLLCPLSRSVFISDVQRPAMRGSAQEADLVPVDVDAAHLVRAHRDAPECRAELRVACFNQVGGDDSRDFFALFGSVCGLHLPQALERAVFILDVQHVSDVLPFALLDVHGNHLPRCL
jgi:MFS family permease